MLLRVHTYGPTPSAATDAVAAAAALPAGAPALGSKTSSTRSVNKGKKGAAATAAAAAASADNEDGSDEADDTEDRVAVRAIYPMHVAQMPQSVITVDMIQSSLNRQLAKERAEASAAAAQTAEAAPAPAEDADSESKADGSAAPAADSAAADDSSDALRNQQGKKQQAKEREKLDAKRRARDAEEALRKLAKPKMRQGMPLKAALAQDLHFGPDVIEHCLLLAGLDPNQTTGAFLAATQSDPAATTFTDASLAPLCAALQEAPRLLERISTEAMPGFIFWHTEQQAAPKPQQPQQPKKPKPEKQKRNKGALVVDEIDLGTTVAGAVAAAASSTAAAPAPAAESSPVADAAPVAAESTPAAAAAATASAASSVADAVAPASSDAATGSDVIAKAGVTLYTEYVPLLLAAHSHRGEYKSMPPPLTYPSFDEAMDEFYSNIEAQKEEVRLIKEKAAALQKLEREKARQATQLQALAQQQELSVLKANLIEQNLAAVNACIGSVNEQIAKGVDWRDLTRMIKEERDAGHNPIARLIHSLSLLENHITVTLSDGLQHLLPENAKNRAIKTYQVDLDLGLSAHSNATLYYESKKKHAAKQQKAECASQAAIKAAERKTNVALSAVDIKARIQKARKVYWFERFHWFISSENFLVIGGKDAQSNEALVKRYLGPRDIYVHAEVHGASSVIIKNHTTGPVPPLTLSQAGSMTICRSAAWKDKIVVEAYWVHADQVSKTPPTGLSLPTGSFMVSGRGVLACVEWWVTVCA